MATETTSLTSSASDIFTGSLFDSPRQQQKEPASTYPLNFEVQLVYDNQQPLSHSVKISKSTRQLIPPTVNYIEIGNNRRFKFEVNESLEKGSVAAPAYIIRDIIHCVSEELKEKEAISLFKFSAKPVLIKKSSEDEIKSLALKIIDYGDVTTTTYTIEEKAVINAFHDQFEGQYLTKGQVVKFKLNDTLVTVQVSSLTSNDGVTIPGVLNPSSSIKLINEKSAFLTVNKVVNFAIPRIYFRVNLITDERPYSPTYVSYSTIKKAVLEKYLKQIAAPGAFWTFKDLVDSHLITLEIQKIEDVASGQSISKESFTNSTVKKALEINEKTQFIFESLTSDLMIGDDEVREAKILLTNVIAMRPHELMQDANSNNCFFSDEIMAKLKDACPEGIYKGLWHLVVNDRTENPYTLDVQFEGASTVLDEPNPKRALQSKYRITDATQLVVTSPSSPSYSFARTRKANPATKIYADIKLTLKPTTGDNYISEKALDDFLRNNIKEVLRSDSYTFFDSRHRLVEIRIREVQNGEVKDSYQHMLGAIGPETKFEFRPFPEKDAEGNPLPDSCVLMKENDPTLEGLDTRGVLKQFGIVGLADEVIKQIDRLVYRIMHPELFKKLGCKKNRGVLLYGIYGTAKTQLTYALRHLCKVRDENCKNISATEVLSMWVGKTEEIIRDLFKPAQKSFQEFGDNMPLHMIVFQEADSLFGNRENADRNHQITPVGELLTRLDAEGDKYPNVIVVMTTNRKEAIDPALLRKGRIGLHLELGIPNEENSEKIFMHYIKPIIDNKFLDKEVNLKKIADRISQRTGAEIEGIVISAIELAVERMLDNKEENPIVTTNDFIEAIRQSSSSRASDMESFKEKQDRIFS